MPRLLQDWIAAQAERRPEAIAIVCGDRRMTYGELDVRSSQVATTLRESGCQRGDRVCSLMPKSPMALVGLLGIYKADAIYVPLDLASPVARLKTILGSCDTRWLLAAGAAARVLEAFQRDDYWRCHLSLGWLDDDPPPFGRFAFTLDDIEAAPATAPAARTRPNDPAHILHTSGSTGIPKGVVITHANLIHFIRWATKYFGMDASDRVSAHAPLHFDLSFFDFFGTAAVGGELHLVPPDINVLPGRLAGFIRESALTQWFSVPSILTYLAKFDVVAPNDFPALKRVLWAGEVFPTPGLIYWMRRLPHATFSNLYGPTETTVASSAYTVPECPDNPQAEIPIGTACAGEEFLVLDDALRPVPRGETGMLYIAGRGLAMGYWRDPERTNAAFLRHPTRPSERIYKTGDLARIGDDGLVYFHGRRDSQVKSRGYRIELGEIEAGLNAVDLVRESAVVAIDGGGFEGATICCAYVPAAGRVAELSTIVQALRRRIPGYMLPAKWQAFQQLPTNANGKIDRPRLRAIFEGKVAVHAAQTTQLA